MRRRSPIALDFGTQAVTALQVEDHAGAVVVRAAARIRLPTAGTAVVDDDARHREWCAAAATALQAAPFRGRTVASAFDLATVATRHVRVPLDALDDAGNRIAAQIQAQDGDGEVSICPVTVADLYEQGERKREFLCCVAPTRAIERRIALLEQLRCRPHAIELAPLAMVRALQFGGGDSFAHLDVGAEDSRITFVRSGQPLMVRPVRHGGDRCRTLLEERLGLDLLALQTLGTAAPDDQALAAAAIEAALAEPLEAIAARIAEGIRYCGALFGGRAVTALRVTGRTAHLPGFVTGLGRRVGLTTELADPFDGIDPGPLATATATQRTGYATALGLCLGGLAA
ncbi:MAG: pilus assembly protein PilM [Planctomycetes bacterium]|nr:pilus assembly protein PilM [Planctomycetota bacterium]